jgi:hypothetical protein
MPADGRAARAFEIVACRRRATGAAARPPIIV